jgi:addiction module RelE/StbE family toxin
VSKAAKIVWTRPAVQDLDSIWEYLKSHSNNAAELVQNRILKAVEKLDTSPYLGRPGHLAGTRELVIPRYPYIVVYGITEAPEALEVVIYHVFHGARNWQQALDDLEE